MPAAFPDPFGPSSRVATSMRQSTRNRLETHQWCIHTEDKVTQDAVTEHLAKSTEASESATSIFYSGKTISVLRVPFEVVMFLKNNRTNGPYKFTPYHREGRSGPWSLWLEGKKTSGQILGARFQGMNKKTTVRN